MRLVVKPMCGYFAAMAKYQHEFRVRVSDELRQAIEDRAKAEARSLNAQIVQLIEAGLAADGDAAGPAGEIEKLRKDVRRILRHIGLK